MRRLTEEEFHELWQISKQKAERMREKTKGIYSKGIRRGDIIFLNNFTDEFEDFLEGRLDEVEKKEEYKEGWAKRDPFNLLNYWALFPIIKRRWLDKDVTTYRMQKEYDKYMINEVFEEELGKESVEKFIDKLNEAAGWYYEKLDETKIYEKLYKTTTITEPNWNGIHKSIPRQILGKMRKFRRRGNL